MAGPCVAPAAPDGGPVTEAGNPRQTHRRYDPPVPPSPAVGGLRPKAILRACYAGMFVQAMLVNLTPLLFVTLAEIGRAHV